MTTYLITRHEGTRIWAEAKARHGQLPFTIDRTLDHLDLSILKKGDVVVGTLPIRMVAELQAKGVKFWSLDIETPPAERGKELTGVQVYRLGGRFARYEVKQKEVEEVAAARARKAAAQKPSISLIPVSDQLAPAAIGWLHMRTEQVCLLASSGMLKRAEVLKSWFSSQENAPKVNLLEWDDSSYAALLAGAEGWVAKLAGELRPQVVVHLTGGTKPMSMALQRAFGKRAEAFGEILHGLYVDTAHRQIEDLLAPERATLPMSGVLNINDMLALQGFQVLSAQSASPGYEQWLARAPLFELLLDDRARAWLPAWYALLSMADWLINDRHNRKRNTRKSDDFADVEWNGSRQQPTFAIVIRDPRKHNWRGLRNALRGKFGAALADCGVARVQLSDTEDRLEIAFDRSERDEFAFAAGGWLEAWLATQFIDAGVDDWAQGLEVSKDGAKNEFDLVAACGNRLLVIEAKTAGLTREGKQDSRAVEAVYKLDALADKLGRYFNDRWLVSLRKLDPMDADRAKNNHGIRVFEGERDPKFAASVQMAVAKWVAGCQLKKSSGFVSSRFGAPKTGGSSIARSGDAASSEARGNQLAQALSRARKSS